jgi:hypothetical protein
MFAMVVLTVAVLMKMFRARVRAVREGLVSAAYFRLYRGELEPESTAKPARHFANRLRKRIRAYFFSWIILLVMWIYLVVEVAVSSTG